MLGCRRENIVKRGRKRRRGELMGGGGGFCGRRGFGEPLLPPNASNCSHCSQSLDPMTSSSVVAAAAAAGEAAVAAAAAALAPP